MNVPTHRAWIPKSNVDDEAFVDFEFELDRYQRRFVHAALDLVLAEVRSPSRRFALYLLASAYIAHSGRGLCVNPAASKRLKPGKLDRKHMYEGQAEAVQFALDLALERGCDDAGHALAHIAQSFLVLDGWNAPKGKQINWPEGGKKHGI